MAIIRGVDREHPLLSTTEVAERWSVSVHQVSALAKEGRLRGEKIGKVWQFAMADVEACEAARAGTLAYMQNPPLLGWEDVVRFLRDELKRAGEDLKTFCDRLDLPDQSVWALLTGHHGLSPTSAAKLQAAFKSRLP